MEKKDYKKELFVLLDEDKAEEFKNDIRFLTPYAGNMVALALILHLRYGIFTDFSGDGFVVLQSAYEDWLTILDTEKVTRSVYIDMKLEPLTSSTKGEGNE